MKKKYKVFLAVISLIVLIAGVSTTVLFYTGRTKKNNIVDKKDLKTDVIKNYNNQDSSEKLDSENIDDKINSNVTIDNEETTTKDEIKTNNIPKKTNSNNTDKSNSTINQNKPLENISSDNNNLSSSDNMSPKDESTDSKTDSTTSDEVKKPQVIKFYESITHGKKEFATENEALERGKEIAEKELDYVISQNKLSGENTIKPDINYFRVYPSVIDENGKTWYYLHFFCQSGENNDDKLKAMY